ncbi:aldehyde dehydrogenase family protein, partial [Streptomyces mirabilis]|uniref:aldehyde dehydrogenase family protein n=1 Tax=Streptomyces mirabilis TaxID=68239 RepID=UPI0033EA7ED8
EAGPWIRRLLGTAPLQPLAAGWLTTGDAPRLDHAYPAHAAFGGYKQSGIGRETHKMMLEHYQQTKNLLVSYSPKKLGFF